MIRSRYLISYKPTLFSRNGRYRTIDINAERAGRKLRVYARRGYHATTESAIAETFRAQKIAGIFFFRGASPKIVHVL